MENHKRKVGGVIIMRPNHNNYGTSLQGYATVKVIEKLGYPFRIIRYNKKRSIKELILTLPGLILSGALQQLRKGRERRKFKQSHPEYAKLVGLRTETVNKFKNKYFEPLCDYYTGWNALKAGSKKYDIVFVGSDQVWSPMSLYAGFYNLMFVDKSVPQFSYASSFGKSFIMKHQRKGVAKFLNKMDAIGVREMRGKEIVEELTNKKATIVADPTLLLTRSEWKNAIANSNKHIDDPYILCYMLGPREDNRKAVLEIAKKTGLKIVVFRHMDYYEPADENFGDIPIYDADCLDFVKLLSNAEYVVTDSFHCSVFSIIFHKKFLTFYRLKPTDKQSSHSRIDSLLSLFGLKNRICTLESNNYVLMEEMNKEIDWNAVDEKLETYRKDSQTFLQECLEMKKNIKQEI